jgi:preprotein translocase subunit SecE
MQLLGKLIKYLQESKTELRKVVWPSKRETIIHTLLVIGISLGMGLFFVILDYLFTLGLEKIISP